MDRPTPKALGCLVQDDFRRQVSFASVASLLRRALLTTKEIAGLRTDIQSGAIQESEIRDFVAALLRDFRNDERFAEDFALAAIAVALENHYSDFAAEYISDLSALKLRELAIARNVARECLKNRTGISLEKRIVPISEIDTHQLRPATIALEPATSSSTNVIVTFADRERATA